MEKKEGRRGHVEAGECVQEKVFSTGASHGRVRRLVASGSACDASTGRARCGIVSHTRAAIALAANAAARAATVSRHGSAVQRR